jgi:hypothetical protein
LLSGAFLVGRDAARMILSRMFPPARCLCRNQCLAGAKYGDVLNPLARPAKAQQICAT